MGKYMSIGRCLHEVEVDAGVGEYVADVVRPSHPKAELAEVEVHVPYRKEHRRHLSLAARQSCIVFHNVTRRNNKHSIVTKQWWLRWASTMK